MLPNLKDEVWGISQLASRLLVIPCLACVILCNTSDAIEMFTFYGDGSRIGLPSLEVPIEAYPGIPLRSDRLRAKRRARRSPGTTIRVGPSGNISVRAMPQMQPMPKQPVR